MSLTLIPYYLHAYRCDSIVSINSARLRGLTFVSYSNCNDKHVCFRSIHTRVSTLLTRNARAEIDTHKCSHRLQKTSRLKDYRATQTEVFYDVS